MSTTPSPPEITAAAVLFSRQFATLISAGVSLVRTFVILEEEAPPPYAEAMRPIRERIEGGDTLTRAIADVPALFPPFYTVMVRAGEVGGILEITLTYVADLLQEDWTLSQLTAVRPLLMAGAGEEPLSPARRSLQVVLFCRAWGSMLASGVPILQAMEVAAESLAPREREEVLDARRVIKAHGTIEEIVARMSFLPPGARTLIILGMECGELDAMLLKAAELYRHQIIYQRQAG